MLLRPWDFLGKSIGVGCHFLLQGIFRPRDQTQDSLIERQMLYHLSHQGSPGVTCYFYRGCFISDADKKVKCYLLLLHLKLSVVVVCWPRHVAHEILVH